MSIGLSTAMSGISVANERLRASAQNIANTQTTDFRRQQVEAQTLQSGGVKGQLRQVNSVGHALEADLTTQKSATYAFVANLRVLQTQLDASGTLLDIHA
ncbi:flagellar basal body rod protein [Roseateles sp.]|uniref:flagellar basal body rod protein n=1 Tax=Roseateles sp. TaxID=1971397 RepID=UPI00286C7CD7|nr:flagellar basal body rod protein [Roseateles sp.]